MSAECNKCGADLLADLTCPECRYVRELATALGKPLDTPWERLIDEVRGVEVVAVTPIAHPFRVRDGWILGVRAEYDDTGKVTSVSVVMEKA